MTKATTHRESAGLIIEHLTKIFSGSVRAIDDVSLNIQPGEMVSFLGPSGCGKTTTLNCIAGLEHPDQGLIQVGDFVMTDGARHIFLQPEERGLGMVFQSYALWPHMTVDNNVGFGLRLAKAPGAEIKRRVHDILELVGLGGMGSRYPFQLSGGQQQRVALARAVVTEPRVLLLDEPLSNLDAKVREAARIWLREIQKRLGITAVYVTHDQAEALAISDMIAVMSQGSLLQYAPPKEIYERPASQFVADFIGQTSMLPGVVVSVDARGAQVKVGSGKVFATASLNGFGIGDTVLLAVRAERIGIRTSTDGDNVLPAKVKSFVYVGSTYEYLLE